MSQWTTVVVAVITSAGTLGVARTARRTPRQERRDDFAAVTKRMDREFERLDGRVTRQEATIRGQAAAIVHLQGWVRALVLFVRDSGMEPPAQPPVPEEALPYLQDIGL
ncbi:hypothetical protein [Actinacidiphila acididurans]|uniref:Secreted protein n=1 Tax=Actinacidiphila acididurans TaxID=2784346 RepID=A0ABS2U326_9ACTN|nr:hypothetical protein [Actinacidiphila acididurans]MBM9510004.1 hypothetical protein [Actinacidiphila acididurans]